MFASWSRSWKFAKMSYRLLGQHKRLILFPTVSSVAAVLVIASFVLPLWQTGQLEQWMAFMDEASMSEGDPMMYVTAFLFYFCNYFVIVFFNSALVACVMKIINGESAPVSYGFFFALKRLPQILGWALVSAVIGVILKAIENSNKKAGAIIASLLGSAWTALTYFVIPVIVIDGVGPVEAFKRSVKTMKTTWGTALVGNFSMGFLSFLLMLPVILIMFALIWLAASTGTTMGIFGIIAVAVALIMIVAAITTTADAIFKALLFAYATGRTLPEDVDESQFSQAFRQKK